MGFICHAHLLHCTLQLKRVTQRDMKTGPRAWNKATRKTGACLRRIRWNPHLGTATAAAVATAVIMRTASATATCTTRNSRPCTWTSCFTTFWRSSAHGAAKASEPAFFVTPAHVAVHSKFMQLISEANMTGIANSIQCTLHEFNYLLDHWTSAAPALLALHCFAASCRHVSFNCASCRHVSCSCASCNCASCSCASYRHASCSCASYRQ